MQTVQHSRSQDPAIAAGRTAAKGESFVIAKAGKPMVKVTALNAPDPSQVKRIGFLAGQVTVPEAGIFNSLGRDEIVAMFGDNE